MDENVNDQVQQDSPTGPEVIRRDPPQEQDQVSKEQSETTKDVEEPKAVVFTDSFGNEYSADEFQQKFLEKDGYITKLEQERKEWEGKAQREAKDMISENKLLEKVPADIKEAIVQIMTPVLDERDRRKEAADQKRVQNEKFQTQLVDAKKSFPGGDGMPKFDETKVLAKMRDPSNEIFDPKWLWITMNWDAYMDRESKKAITGKTPKTESTGGDQPRKPQARTPKTWEEAGASAMTRG